MVKMRAIDAAIEILKLVALSLFIEVAKEIQAAGTLPDRKEWAGQCQERKRTMLRKTNFDSAPLKPQRVYEEMNRAVGKDACYVSTIGLSQIAGAQFLHVYKPKTTTEVGLAWFSPYKN